jgi:hypothetical protein
VGHPGKAIKQPNGYGGNGGSGDYFRGNGHYADATIVLWRVARYRMVHSVMDVFQLVSSGFAFFGWLWIYVV